jgi:EmrB/QacA subfamily drug resistance transporter
MSTQRWSLWVVAAASLMVALDSLVVSTALTTIRADLAASVAQLEWTVNAYNLVFAVLLLPAAALGDRFGRRRMFAGGLALFTAASAWCALSPSIESLIAGRAVQGAGAALVTTLAFALVGTAFPPERRGAALGALQGIVGLALIAGPLAGGVIAQSFSWPWIFWLNVPIGLVVLPLSLRRISESRGADARLDLGGLACVTAGAFCLVWGLVRANDIGWGETEIVVALAAGVALLGAFVAWERRVGEPMLPLGMFRSRAFTGGNVATACLFATIFTGLFFFAQFFQTVLGAGAAGAGVRLLPWTALLVFLGPLVGRLADHVGERPLLLGGLLTVAAGYGWVALTAQPDMPYWQLAVPLVISAIGGCCALPAAATAVLRQLPPEAVGKASGANGMFRELGGVFGLAVTVAVFAAVGGYASPQAFTRGFAAALAVAAGLAVIGAAAGALVPAKTQQPQEDPMGLNDGRVEAVIAVSDLERARAFYEDQLGLVPGEEEEQGVRYPCADGTRIFIYLSPEKAGASSATLAGWFVDDLDATIDELAARGAAFERYDQPGLRTDERGVFDAGGFRAAWLADPDGNTMAVTELA